MDEQDNTHLLESDLNDFQPMPRNLFVGGAEQEQSNTSDDERTPIGYATQPEEQLHVPAEARRRHSRQNASPPERSMEAARMTKLEERTRVLEMAMGKILSRLIPNDPLIPLLNRELEKQLKDIQSSVDELKSPRSRQQALDLDSAPLNQSITTEPYQEGFKIPHLETYDGSGNPDEHLHTYQAIMKIQNATDAMMCKVFPTTLKSTARRWEIKRTTTELMQVHQREGESLRDYMQRFNKATLDIDNVLDTICLSALLHSLKPDWFLDDLLENPPKSWNEVNDRSASFILSEDFQSSKRRADDKQSKKHKQPEAREEKKKQKHWVKRPPPQMHEYPRANRSKYCDYHWGYGHNTDDYQSLKDELEFLARNEKLEGYVHKPYA
ncbi:hypothetical protein SLEP1_g28109 [Rubroshorea leprosula]|uniref:Retrotransposon gag domain-containing protein n=1 Tax=Rubroshorea leprosula TaxID=152421 RepID=A0AAV5K1Y7_9ROSI|nr:hypothetical protein SLEP1_g28109 [Rubroshorea leprosula]